MAKRAKASQWRTFTCQNLAQIERRGGLYALYNQAGELVYIGSSGNIRARLVDHVRLKTGVRHIKVSYMRGAWYRREQRLLRRLRPLLNKRITKRNLRSPN